MTGLPTYKRKRRLVQTLSTLLVVVLPFFNIMRLDVPTLRFYFFNSVLWVDEFYLLFLVTMLILWVIVIFSMLYGRVWCGWMCPQTVLNELHRWFTKKLRRWMAVPPASDRRPSAVGRRLLFFAIPSLAAAALSLLIAFNLVAYFVDPYRMIADIAAGSLGPVTGGIIAGIAALMYVDIIFWREKFCTKACPYAMLQSVLIDSTTQVVRYQTERTEECIECKACVRDCIMGIDIRQSPYQTECIHCGDCVDSCAAVLSRLKTPLPTLITFSWGDAPPASEAPRLPWYRRLGLVDAKRWGMVGLTAAYAAVLVVVIHLRQPVSLSASGDRSTLYHIAGDGRIINDYKVKISNRSMSDGWFVIACEGSGRQDSDCIIAIDQNPIFLQSREVKNLQMTITTNGRQFHPGPNRIVLKAVNRDDAGIHVSTEAVFFMPEERAGGAEPHSQKESL